MRKIERPDWKILTGECPMDSCYVSPYHIKELDKWFDNYLKDKWIVDESEMVEVKCWKSFYTKGWCSDEIVGRDNSVITHKAYLVGIEKIKKKSREEELEGIVKEFLSEGPTPQRNVWMTIYERAKAALKREPK